MAGKACGDARCVKRHHFLDAEEEAKAFDARKKRKAAKEEQEAEGEEPHDKVDKKHRAREFADWVVSTFGVDYLNRGEGVLDIAGGKGSVGYELWLQHRVRCTLVDPVLRKVGKSRRKALAKADGGDLRRVEALFDDNFKTDPERASILGGASLLLGMHPDQATEPIVDGAIAAGKPWAVVPCCVFASLAPDRVTPSGESVVNTKQFVEYLAAKAEGSQQASLRFEGRNRVVYNRMGVPAPLGVPEVARLHGEEGQQEEAVAARGILRGIVGEETAAVAEAGSAIDAIMR